MITEKLLVGIGVSTLNSKVYAPILEKARIVSGDSFNTISSKKGVAMLIGQAVVESLLFTRTQEDLTYSIKALKSLIGRDPKTGRQFRYFTDAQAELYGYIRNTKGKYVQEANQRMIGNLYYGNRMGNRGSDTEDGYELRGVTLIQLTGRYNISRWAASLGLSVEKAVEYGKTPEGAVDGLMWYWRNHGLLVPASRGDVVECTRLIQGGSKALDQRTIKFNQALSLLG